MPNFIFFLWTSLSLMHPAQAGSRSMFTFAFPPIAGEDAITLTGTPKTFVEYFERKATESMLLLQNSEAEPEKISELSKQLYSDYANLPRYKTEVEAYAGSLKDSSHHTWSETSKQPDRRLVTFEKWLRDEKLFDRYRRLLKRLKEMGNVSIDQKKSARPVTATPNSPQIRTSFEDWVFDNRAFTYINRARENRFQALDEKQILVHGKQVLLPIRLAVNNGVHDRKVILGLLDRLKDFYDLLKMPASAAFPASNESGVSYFDWLYKDGSSEGAQWLAKNLIKSKELIVKRAQETLKSDADQKFLADLDWTPPSNAVFKAANCPDLGI